MAIRKFLGLVLSIACCHTYGASIDCPITEQNLAGTWKGIDTGGFEEMAFDLQENKRLFLSWLHHRPEMTGNWTFSNCEIYIADPVNPALSFEYKVLAFVKGILYLQEAGDKRQSAYSKMK